MIQNGMLPEFIDNMLQQNNEDKLWEMYLAVGWMQDKSFDDWKVITTNREDQEQKTEYTPEEAVAHAEGILAGFKPF